LGAISEGSTHLVEPGDPTEHAPVPATSRARHVIDADVGRRAQMTHRLLQRADIELKPARDADMAEEAPDMIENEPENLVLRATGTSPIQACHAGVSAANGASSEKFRQGSRPPNGDERVVHARERQPELGSKTDAAELMIAVPTEERHEVVDFDLHR